MNGNDYGHAFLTCELQLHWLGPFWDCLAAQTPVFVRSVPGQETLLPVLVTAKGGGSPAFSMSLPAPS